MTKTNQVSEAPGAEVTPEQIKQYLQKDLSIALACLHAIYSDPDLLRLLADFMHGRQVNYINAEKAAHQERLDHPEPSLSFNK